MSDKKGLKRKSIDQDIIDNDKPSGFQQGFVVGAGAVGGGYAASRVGVYAGKMYAVKKGGDAVGGLTTKAASRLGFTETNAKQIGDTVASWTKTAGYGAVAGSELGLPAKVGAGIAVARRAVSGLYTEGQRSVKELTTVPRGAMQDAYRYDIQRGVDSVRAKRIRTAVSEIDDIRNLKGGLGRVVPEAEVAARTGLPKLMAVSTLRAAGVTDPAVVNRGMKMVEREFVGPQYRGAGLRGRAQVRSEARAASLAETRAAVQEFKAARPGARIGSTGAKAARTFLRAIPK